jgi:hypothetical protein
MHEEFLPNESESSSAEISSQAFIAPTTEKEFVKVMVVGSRKGINLIIKLLHCLRFAEVREWSPPVPYEDSGKMISLVRKKVSLK